ncbi:hypothetical protein WICMUC_001515 [Wickerhamomyces mucosus]|uniref:Uncharacterized protein n=1 Tax=Wickerhamomyces mucosus TaxID=1378264 RepID=A0A9P8TGA0_9ASCO|nr:hypothetical protein WICMUC_001515 [Wickerhamomyces mucosus]
MMFHSLKTLSFVDFLKLGSLKMNSSQVFKVIEINASLSMLGKYLNQFDMILELAAKKSFLTIELEYFNKLIKTLIKQYLIDKCSLL